MGTFLHMRGISRPESVRFWEKVEQPSAKDCWIWKGGTTTKGRGCFGLTGGKIIGAHAFSYLEVIKGEISGRHLHHTCRNGHLGCVNPFHLEPLTPKDHIHADGTSPSALNALKTHCLRGHPLSGDNVRIGSKGRRVCKTCHRIDEQNRRHYAHKI